ncbi:MAG: outer membrane beta-barrel protein [Macellibacteroides fermentans]|uniref:outer membrane beta-barrel protein n=1 Tax=Macellibacteroides fermentans TaxID=879969 RepID=UPI003AD6A814
MRKINLLTVMLFIVLAASAQLRLIPEVGVTILKVGDFNAGVGARIGMGMRYSFNGNDSGFALASGLYYSQRNSTTFNGAMIFGTNSGISGSTVVTIVPGSEIIPIPEKFEIDDISILNITTRRDYLQLPIMVEYGWNVAEGVRFHTAVGPYVGVGISGNNQIKSIKLETDNKLSASNSSANPFDLLKYDRFDWGATVQVGLEVKNFAFIINYNTNLYKRNSTGKENLFSIGAGYSF